MTPPPSTFYDELLLPDGRAHAPGCEPVAAWLAATDAADIESLNQQALAMFPPQRRYLHGLQRSEQHRARDSV